MSITPAARTSRASPLTRAAKPRTVAMVLVTPCASMPFDRSFVLRADETHGAGSGPDNRRHYIALSGVRGHKARKGSNNSACTLCQVTSPRRQRPSRWHAPRKRYTGDYMTKSAMLRPKSRGRARRPYIPAIAPESLGNWFARLLPAERALLRHIASTADLVQVEGAPDHLLVPVTPRMLDVLATFEAELEDAEFDLGDEPQDEDDDTNNDWEDVNEDGGEVFDPLARDEILARRRGAIEARRRLESPTYAAWMDAKRQGDPDAVTYMNWLRVHPPAWTGDGRLRPVAIGER